MSDTHGGAFLDPAQAPDAIFTPEDFDAEQQALFDTARRFCDGQVWPRLADIEAKVPGVLEGLMQQASELGLTMLDLPEEHGGLDLPLPVSMRVLESTGREQSFMLTLMVQNGIGSLPVALFGTDAQKAEWLPGFASGARRGCYCLTEPGSGSDALAARSTAVLDGDQWVLSGTKQFITNAGIADVGFVFAKVQGEVDGQTGFSCFIVPFDAPGVSLGAEEHKLGMYGSSTRQVILQDARIPRGNVLGQIGRGHVIAFNILNNGRYKLGGTALGSAKSALDAALDYAAGRRQFGQRIADFGMIRRKIGQAAADIYAVESASYRAGGAIDTLANAGGRTGEAKLAALQDFALECSIAKIAGSELLGRVADEALQMFGGYGFLEEYPAAKYLRDARIARIYEGTNEINRIVMPRTLLKKLAAGELTLGADLGDGPGDGPLASLKAAHAACFNAAVERHGSGKGFDADQELMAHLADMMTAIYLAESTALRVARHPRRQPVHDDIAQLVLAQAAAQVAQLAAEASTHLGIVAPAVVRPAADVLALRQRIAAHVVDAGRCTL
jgi:alkylation response protein AidB-like acyl-CoA dehydrogenase